MYRRYGASCRLTRNGREVWAKSLPCALWKAGVTDDGIVAGYAYSHGFQGEGEARGRPGDFHVVMVDAGGRLVLNEAVKRQWRRFPALATRRNISTLFLAAETPFHGIYYKKCQAYRLGRKPRRKNNGRFAKRDLLRLERRNTRKNAVLQAIRY